MNWQRPVPGIAAIFLAASVGSNALGQFDEDAAAPDLEGTWVVKSVTESREPLYIPDSRSVEDQKVLSLHFLKNECEIWESQKKTGSTRVYVGQLTIPYSPWRSFFYEVDHREHIFRKGLIAVEGDSLSLRVNHGDKLLPRAFVPKHRHVSFQVGFERGDTPKDATTSVPFLRHDMCGSWKLRGADGVSLSVEPGSLEFSCNIASRKVPYEFVSEQHTGSLFLRLHGDEPLFVRLAVDVSDNNDVVSIYLVPKVSDWLAGVLPEKLPQENRLVFRRE